MSIYRALYLNVLSGHGKTYSGKAVISGDGEWGLGGGGAARSRPMLHRTAIASFVTAIKKTLPPKKHAARHRGEKYPVVTPGL